MFNSTKTTCKSRICKYVFNKINSFHHVKSVNSELLEEAKIDVDITFEKYRGSIAELLFLRSSMCNRFAVVMYRILLVRSRMWVVRQSEPAGTIGTELEYVSKMSKLIS